MPAWVTLLRRGIEPLLMLANMIVPQVVIWWLLCFEELMGPYLWPASFDFVPDQSVDKTAMFRLGIGLLVAHALSWLSVVSPLVWTHVQFWFCLPRDASDRSVMVVESDDLPKRRFCGHCGTYQDDRVEHSDRHPFRRCCAPLWVHFCPWIFTGVYANSLKAFFRFIVALICYQATTVGIIAFVLTDPRAKRCRPYVGGLVVVALGVVIPSVEFWRQMMRVLRNKLVNNERWYGFFVKLSLPGYEPRTIEWTENNGVPFPFDLGRRENFHHLLGPWYILPFFWIKWPGQCPRWDGTVLRCSSLIPNGNPGHPNMTSPLRGVGD